jgi:hypothetical protein
MYMVDQRGFSRSGIYDSLKRNSKKFFWGGLLGRICIEKVKQKWENNVKVNMQE